MSSNALQGVLMESHCKLFQKGESSSYPILAPFNKNQQRVACKALLDHCCTNTGLISRELTKMSDLPASIGTPKTFITMAGTFTMDKVLKFSDTILLCLSMIHTLTLKLMIITKECSSELNNGEIIRQELR
jgi:hypothetical protein